MAIDTIYYGKSDSKTYLSKSLPSGLDYGLSILGSDDHLDQITDLSDCLFTLLNSTLHRPQTHNDGQSKDKEALQHYKKEWIKKKTYLV